ncbi:guanylate cyclase alpha-like [Microplitis mediator]|uniref:guanylate cyclase alpha-like n=1 Tax=Microplitis mediator TaxID=375433 RepID=UPI0025568B93|nr:guanylate cyclase alpha-like [Microplitis mediator]XP_057321290.1 guanylate cyclase alpha-like [Microplitis mediator]
MSSNKKLDDCAHKRLIIQLQRYRNSQKKKDIEQTSSSSDNDNDGLNNNDHKNNNFSSTKNQTMTKKNDLSLCDQVTTEDIKNLVLASYRSLSRQVSSLSDQLDDVSSRLSILESSVNINNKEIGKVNEEIVETKNKNEDNDKDKDENDDNLIILESGDEESEIDTSVRLKFPLKTERDFYIFNSKISGAGYRRKLIQRLSSLVNKKIRMPLNVGKIFRYYLSKDLALCYNTKILTPKKKVFIDTLFYSCIAEVLKNKYGKSKPLLDSQIHDSISVVLKNVYKWDRRTLRR